MYKIGTDIVEVERIKKAIERTENFKTNVFSTKEIEYCENKKNKYKSYAGKFAAKEAYFKAKGTGIEIPMRNTEILNDENGKPYILISGEKINGDVSISHTEHNAISFVILY